MAEDSQEWQKARNAQLDKVNDLLKDFAGSSSDEEETQEDISKAPEEEEDAKLVQRQLECLEKVKTMREKMDGEIEKWNDKTDSIKKNDKKYDPVRSQNVIRRGGQGSSESLPPIVIGKLFTPAKECIHNIGIIFERRLIMIM